MFVVLSLLRFLVCENMEEMVGKVLLNPKCVLEGSSGGVFKVIVVLQSESHILGLVLHLSRHLMGPSPDQNSSPAPLSDANLLAILSSSFLWLLSRQLTK